MKRTVSMSAVAAAAVLALSSTANAQVFTPSYQAPVPMNDLGVYLSDSPGDLTLEGIWRSGPVGLRVGYVDAEPDGLISVGGEVRSPIATSAPIDVAFTAGAQGLIGDVDALGLQAGLSIGKRFVNPGLALTPYIHPRIALIDGLLQDDDWDTELLAELGLDAEFSQNLIFRLSVGLSDQTPDVGVGLAWRR
ncbi:hypothetical protein [Longimicrobium sp.]|uniref:hypothetical protein n=1 Tax=Longimicrobium sp. TaxID=2029185 RepID=UPI002E36E0CD|nr:hypothetical protein [Longimicrobium sp.]HEX6042223.1 hypothetical protein [Longimicrobium sp.]